MKFFVTPAASMHDVVEVDGVSICSRHLANVTSFFGSPVCDWKERFLKYLVSPPNRNLFLKTSYSNIASCLCYSSTDIALQ